MILDIAKKRWHDNATNNMSEEESLLFGIVDPSDFGMPKETAIYARIDENSNFGDVVIGTHNHTNNNFEHLSGFYDIMFIKNGLIHAKLSYISAKDRKEKNEMYIWTKVD